MGAESFGLSRHRPTGTEMKRVLLPLAALAIAGLLFTNTRAAYGCSCVPSSTQQKVENTDVIVIGTVVRLVEDPDERVGTDLEVDGIVSVERYLKGSGPSEIEVDDPPSGGLCGFLDQASAGRRYLFFLKGEGAHFSTSSCAGSIPITEDAASQQHLRDVEAAVAGAGSLPDTGSAPPSEEPGSDTLWLAIIIGSSLAGASAWLVRRASRG